MSPPYAIALDFLDFLDEKNCDIERKLAEIRHVLENPAAWVSPEIGGLLGFAEDVYSVICEERHPWHMDRNDPNAQVRVTWT